MLFPVCVLTAEGGKVGVSPLAPGLRFSADSLDDLIADVRTAQETMTLGECDDAQRVIADNTAQAMYEGGYWVALDLDGAAAHKIGEPYKLNVSMDTVLYGRIKQAAKAAGTNVSAFVREAVRAKLARG